MLVSASYSPSNATVQITLTDPETVVCIGALYKTTNTPRIAGIPANSDLRHEMKKPPKGGFLLYKTPPEAEVSGGLMLLWGAMFTVFRRCQLRSSQPDCFHLRNSVVARMTQSRQVSASAMGTASSAPSSPI